jgi:hypothetical protein
MNMQASLFDPAPEPEVPVPSFSLSPKEVKAVKIAKPPAPEMTVIPAQPFHPSQKLDLPAWLRKHKYDLILCELVVRAKTIEANHLHTEGSEAELKYLLEAYGGDETLLRADVVDTAQYIQRHHMQAAAHRTTEETSLT